ncbi:hypothetical protein M501DRAFT_939727 [Patellaria atrata CBS 101060]|uniref:Autophagy-related protein 14 n=1 Tax=Patellaria atrata CBS 101060 TaxID=1346257 RepID=A0A9P4S5E9_9PEZI|nr:hypothetical protein M501DRAFT_939727 [Patellaria atrata CBS 101060]
MQCDICERAPVPKLQFHCPTCVRTALYPVRIALATTLIDKEKVGQHVEALVNNTDAPTNRSITLSGALFDLHESAKTADLERVRAEITEVEERVRLITEQAELLKRQVEASKKEIAAKKAAAAQRRSDAESAKHEVESRRANELNKLSKTTKHSGYRWDSQHGDTVHARMFLCREAASLAGLKQRKRRVKDGSVRDEYIIGGVPIVDLRHLNSAPYTEITASLTHVAHLLVRVAHYLAVRLPSEIVLPHKDYPLPTIFTPGSSYSARDVSFPGSTPTQTSNNSPEASRTLDQRPMPRPRTLFLDRILHQLFKEDPSAYSLFVEGATLLAWNIAWLCRSQGMHSDFDRADNICSMGKNLWRLLVEKRQAPPLRRDPSSRENIEPSKDPRVVAALGHFSHGTSHSFLGSYEGVEYMRIGKIQTPTKVIDRVKATLLTEMQGAEWEVLDEKEWGEENEGVNEEPILVGAKRRVSEQKSGPTSGSPVPSSVPEGSDRESTVAGKGRGVNGWMKLKSRTSDVDS